MSVIKSRRNFEGSETAGTSRLNKRLGFRSVTSVWNELPPESMQACEQMKLLAYDRSTLSLAALAKYFARLRA